MARLSLEIIKKTPTKNVNVKDLYKYANYINKQANSAIKQLKKSGFVPMVNQSKYYINPKTGQFPEINKNSTPDQLRRAINQRKAYFATPGNTLKGAKKEYRDIKKSFKDFSKTDYHAYRQIAGRYWAKVDKDMEAVRNNSDGVREAIIESRKKFTSFRDQMNYINDQLDKEQKEIDLANKMAERSIIANEEAKQKWLKSLNNNQ